MIQYKGTDSTGKVKPVQDVVRNAANNSNLGYNKDTQEILESNLNAKEQIIAGNLENERDKGEDSISKDVIKKVAKGKEDFESVTGKYTSLRVFSKIKNDGNKLLGIKNEKDEDKK